ncbi:lasso peptide biosynthesis B2 protein [Streptomyces sp. ATCC51928]|uniref:Lasso peptide biosynthesis B2 protein n=1 Tax=Streptomyces caviscabies TaxID=90079 RepID=A0ABW2MM36_9ACTN|nr:MULTISPECIES: lasso peptide biosynthesis B2 protein [unclassified Streptomyces]MDX3500953.1 lasso peptide biosynthesis B2 protein [Streptomyces sp. ATCC51928]MDX5521014.1 lasso peptide biosynthesis B2 protein [Streptomyces sp. DE06-01C]
MTTEMTMPRRGAGAGGVRLRTAIVAAFVLARLKPGRLRRALARCARGARPASYAETMEVLEAVVATSRRCASRYGCLPRSVAVALACRMSGVWPDWCAGVRSAPPFAPHAWLQAEGRTVGEQAEPADLRPLMVVAAAAVTAGGGVRDERGVGDDGGGSESRGGGGRQRA